jgi:hypothetical protein
MHTFDSPTTKDYISTCISLAERIASRADQAISGADLVTAIQSELHIPIAVSELPPSGILGLGINLITIVSHDEEDPVELIMSAFKEEGVEASCFPASHDRNS